MGLLESKVRIAILLAADFSGRKARFRVGHAGTHNRESERVLDRFDQTGMFPERSGDIIVLWDCSNGGEGKLCCGKAGLLSGFVLQFRHAGIGNNYMKYNKMASEKSIFLKGRSFFMAFLSVKL